MVASLPLTGRGKSSFLYCCKSKMIFLSSVAEAARVAQNFNTHGTDALCCFQSSPALERHESFVKIAQGQFVDILHANDGKDIAREAFLVTLGVRGFPFALTFQGRGNFPVPGASGNAFSLRRQYFIISVRNAPDRSMPPMPDSLSDPSVGRLKSAHCRALH